MGSSPNFGCTGFAYTGNITVGSPTSETATNVSASVSVTSSGLIYQRLGQTGTETVTICNNSAVSAIAGPIYLVLSITGSGVTAVNNTSTSTALGGAPYWTAQPGSLAPSACVPVTVKLSYGIDNFTTTPTVYSGYPMSIN